jgi:hypothetical protein
MYDATHKHPPMPLATVRTPLYTLERCQQGSF